MRTKKKYVFLGVSITIIIIIIIFCLADGSSIQHYEGEEYYDGENLDIYDVFPRKIPETAETVEYINHRYYDKSDIYLELRFSNRETMDAYLDEMRIQMGKDSLIEKGNPHSPSYIDLFPEGVSSRIYYTIECTKRGNLDISGAYCVLSYSYDELTVISTKFYGQRINPVHYSNSSYDLKIPRYLTRFGIDLETPAEYYVR